jgi:hypothetical protein
MQKGRSGKKKGRPPRLGKGTAKMEGRDLCWDFILVDFFGGQKLKEGRKEGA